MNGYDIDGTLTTGLVPETPCVVISGRTFAEYDDFAKKLAQSYPVYIRGVGPVGDNSLAGEFKATMIRHLGVTRYFEDSPVQADIIRRSCPEVEIVMVGNG